MPGRDTAEIYFITAMMILIIILSVAAVVIFVRTYKKEMKEKDARKAKKLASASGDDVNKDGAS